MNKVHCPCGISIPMKAEPFTLLCICGRNWTSFDSFEWFDHVIARCLAGRALTKLIKQKGIVALARACLSCDGVAREMDTKGCEWCREHVDELVKKIETNWLENKRNIKGNWRTLLAKVPLLRRAGIRLLIIKAIVNAELEFEKSTLPKHASWSVAVTTAPRGQSYLDSTLNSLKDAGFVPTVYGDG